MQPMPRCAPTTAEGFQVKQIVEWFGSDFDKVIISTRRMPCRTPLAARGEAAVTSPPHLAGAAPACIQHAFPMPASSCLRRRRDHRSQSRLCAAARPRGAASFLSPRAPGSSGRSGSGGVAAMSFRPRAAALGLYRPLGFLRRRRMRGSSSTDDASTGSHLRRLCRRLCHHPPTISCGDAGRQYHRRRRRRMERPRSRRNPAARSTFRGAKQQFFGHLLGRFRRPPGLLRSIAADLKRAIRPSSDHRRARR